MLEDSLQKLMKKPTKDLLENAPENVVNQVQFNISNQKLLIKEMNEELEKLSNSDNWIFY